MLFEDERYTWDEHVARRPRPCGVAIDTAPDGPFHIGFLFENMPELCFWLGAGAVSGATMVGINPTRQGAELARDITLHRLPTDRHRAPLRRRCSTASTLGLRTTASSSSTRRRVRRDAAAVRRRQPAPTPSRPDVDRAAALHVGHLGRTQGGHHLAGQVGAHRPHDLDDAGARRGRRRLHGDADVPLQRAVRRLQPIVYAGGTLALRRKFSASGFLPDVRKFGPPTSTTSASR